MGCNLHPISILENIRITQFHILMSFSSNLIIEDKSYKVLDCTFDFEQQLDQNGRPSGTPRGGILLLTLEFTGDTSLFSWMIEPNMTKNGRLVFSNRDGMSNLMTINFSNAYCGKLSGYFNHVGTEPIKLRIKVTAESMEFNSIPFKNNWPQKS